MSIFVCTVCLKEILSGSVSMLNSRQDGLETMAVYCSDVKCQCQLHIDSQSTPKSKVQTYSVQRTYNKITSR